MAGSLIGAWWRVVRQAVRLVISYWPSLMTLFLIGTLGQFLVIQGAGWVGASSSATGLALMPIAILFRLTAFVAMLLIVRGAMPTLTALSPVPTDRTARRREFTDALLAGVLPFFAFYFAWGYLGDDMRTYYLRVFEVQNSRDAAATLTGQQIEHSAYGTLTLTWFTGLAIVITFILRRLAKRFAKKWSRVLPIITVYLEAIWVFLSALVIGDLLSRITTWVDGRQGLVWWNDFRRSLSLHVAPLDWLLQVGAWLIGEVGGLILLPLAWITIAGVVYGQALTVRPVAAGLARSKLAGSRLVQKTVSKTVSKAVSKAGDHEAVAHVRRRFREASKWLWQRLGDVWNDLVERVRPIGDAIALMWHVGPVLVAGYVLLYRSVDWLAAEITVQLPRLLGPHPADFWRRYGDSILQVAPVVTAPVVIGVVAASCDAVLGQLRKSNTAT